MGKQRRSKFIGPAGGRPIVEVAPHRLLRGDPAAGAVARLVAEARGVSLGDLLCRSRSPAPVASARQLAMYLTHVMLGRNLTEVGRLFGRDRTTVAHACALIEDAREMPAFDEEVGMLESAIAEVGRPFQLTGGHHAAG